MIAVGIVFLILALASAGYLIWRFNKSFSRQDELRQKAWRLRGNFVLAYKRVSQWIAKTPPKDRKKRDILFILAGVILVAIISVATHGVGFFVIATASVGYLIWRFVRWFTHRQPSLKVTKTEATLMPESLPIPQKKQKVKTAKCPVCGQRTIKDATLSCQWCGSPLIGKAFVEREEKAKKAKEPKPPKEKPVVVKTPFLFSFIGCLLIVALVVLVIGGAFYGLLMTEALDDVLGSNDIYLQIKAIVNPPKPVVVSQDTFEAAPGGDYTIIGRCEVRNEGGSGKVRVTASLNAYGQPLTKSETIYLRSGQTEVVEFYFSEVTVERRILEGILSYLMGGGFQGVTSPDVDLDIWATPAR